MDNMQRKCNFSLAYLFSKRQKGDVFTTGFFKEDNGGFNVKAALRR